MIIVGTINEERKSFVFFSDKNKKNVSKFHHSLKNTGWQSIYNETDANIAYDSFLSKYFDIYNSSFPLRKVKAPKHLFKRPWLSEGLLKSIKRKDKL